MLESIRSRLLLLGSMTVALLAIGLWQSKPAPSADVASCAVYRAFYAGFPDKTKFFLNPETSSETAKVRNLTAPSEFKRDTSKFEEAAGDSVSGTIGEDFSYETEGFFDPIVSGEPRSIIGCFVDLEVRPNFYSGEFWALHDREGDPGQDGDAAVTVVTLANISPVAFSDDGQVAVIYTEYQCGSLCGAGYFVLFAQIDDKWIRLGDSWRWVS